MNNRNKGNILDAATVLKPKTKKLPDAEASGSSGWFAVVAGSI